MVKKLMNTAAKTEINAAKKIGDKYRKKIMDTAKREGIIFSKTAGKKILKKSAEDLEI